jgi:mono/diheme cytochrome c family protein
VFREKPCAGCHGENAQGDFGPKIAGTELSFEDVHKRVREGEAPMPPFSPEQVSDQDIRDIYAWLQSLQ